MPSFTRESGGTLHVAVMGVNRIGKGFSNGAEAVLGPPDFEEASVELVHITAETDLPLNY